MRAGMSLAERQALRKSCRGCADYFTAADREMIIRCSWCGGHRSVIAITTLEAEMAG